MIVGGVLVRVWLPVCEDVDALLSAASISGMPNTVSLVPIALLLMLLHPFTPGDPRSWTALELSTKAVAFTTAFIIGSNYCLSVDWCAVGEAPPSLTTSTTHGVAHL